MVDLRGTVHLFDVEHHSVRIEMSDPAGGHKTLHLSPVMLAYWLNFFSTRSRDPNGWGERPCILEVADVDVAEQLFLYCYNPYIFRKWIRDDREWSWIVSAVETCDMLQAEDVMMDDVFELVHAKIGKAERGNMYQCLLDMMSIFRGVPVGANKRYRSLTNAGFDRIKTMTGDFDIARSLMPEEMYLEYSWYVFGTGQVWSPRSSAAIILIARDLAATKDDDRAQIHIRMIDQRDEIVRPYPPEVVLEVRDILEKIDTTSTMIMRARDTLMLYLKQVTFGKRKRDA